MIIYLLRHGETTGDIEDIMGGDYDDHLTKRGRDQAKKLGEKLKDKKITKIFSSPKIRTLESSEIISEIITSEIEIMDLLKVRNHYGVMTGLTRKEAEEKYPDLIKLFEADSKNTIEGGESYSDFYQRTIKAIEKISQLEDEYEVVAVMTHRGFIRALFRDYLNIGEIVIDFAGFVELESKNGKLRVKHLENARVG